MLRSPTGGLGEGRLEGGRGGRVGRLAVRRGVDVPLPAGRFGRDHALDAVGAQGQAGLGRHAEPGGHQCLPHDYVIEAVADRRLEPGVGTH